MLKILLRFVPEFSSDMFTHIHTHAHTRICVYTHPLRRAHNDATFSSLKCLPAFVTVFASTFSFFFHSPSLSLRLFSPLSAASCRCSSLLLPLVLLPISVILASRPARLFYVQLPKQMELSMATGSRQSRISAPSQPYPDSDSTTSHTPISISIFVCNFVCVCADCANKAARKQNVKTSKATH